jgi:nucleoside-diphosphate-sugar epimerase
MAGGFNKMIIGNGDIATTLKAVQHGDDVLFFASGVSDSVCADECAYAREKALLAKQPIDKHLVYFSSLSVYHSTSRYASHKYEMEQIVKFDFASFTIVRLGNILWGKNQKTLINYLREAISNHHVYRVEPVFRFVVGENDFITAMHRVVSERPQEMTVFTDRLMVSEIVRKIRRGEM